MKRLAMVSCSKQCTPFSSCGCRKLPQSRSPPSTTYGTAWFHNSGNHDYYDNDSSSSYSHTCRPFILATKAGLRLCCRLRKMLVKRMWLHVVCFGPLWKFFKKHLAFSLYTWNRVDYTFHLLSSKMPQEDYKKACQIVFLALLRIVLLDLLSCRLAKILSALLLLFVLVAMLLLPTASC